MQLKIDSDGRVSLSLPYLASCAYAALGLGRRDVAGGALEVAVHTRAVCPQTDGQSRSGGPTALQDVRLPRWQGGEKIDHTIAPRPNVGVVSRAGRCAVRRTLSGMIVLSQR